MSTHQSRTTTRRLVGAGTNLVLIAATLLAVAFLAPSLMGYQRYVITGGSMTGTISKGSVVFERPVAVDDLEIGDVITYQPPSTSGIDSLVTHRIVQISDRGGQRTFRTQGDANPDIDPWSFSLVDDRQPVVKASVPYVGYAIIALADRDTRMLLIGVPAAVVAVIALFQLVAALTPRRTRRAEADVPNCGDLVDLLSPARGLELSSVDMDRSRPPARAGHR